MSRRTFVGKVVMITGADSGLGLAFAERFYDRGAKLILLTQQVHFVDLESIVREKGWDRSSRIHVVDFSNILCYSSVASEAFEREGRIDVLINNIGKRLKKSLFDVTVEDWDLLVDANMKIPFFLSQAVAKKMVEAQLLGSIINISSQLGVVSSYDHSIYSTTKGGLISLTRAMAIDLARFNVSVNSVAPGPINTIASGLFANDDEVLDFLQRMPILRRVELSEVVDAVEYLGASAGGAVTGHTLVVDGGWTSL